jgi:hypothetical protein
MITKKHLNELADIVFYLSKQGEQDGANAVEGFARRYAPNFDQSRWDAYMHKLEKREDWIEQINGN